MRAIHVTFRALFEGPLGVLNPMGLKIPGTHPVEIFGSGERWYARELASRARHTYNKLGTFMSVEHAKREIPRHFARQVEEWQTWGIPPNADHKSMLTPYEVADLGRGKFGWIQDEDRTHIIHAPSIPPGAKVPPAACGAQVHARCFISTKANIEPTCRSCAEVWRKEYKNK